MCRSLSEALSSKDGWQREPASQEMDMFGTERQDCRQFDVPLDGGSLTYAVVDSTVTFGGALSPVRADEALLQRRLAKAEQCYHQYRRRLACEAPYCINLKHGLHVRGRRRFFLHQCNVGPR